MKKIYLLASCILYLSLFNNSKAQKTGYILLNEYMPWATNSCSISSEFAELYNFGPGPVDIGCYIVTDGDYTITIPPNTVVNAGQYYVISGMDSIPTGCANINYVTHVNLNFNTCNCTSGPIPSTGGGWLTDGGSASEQVVFLDPDLKVVDAVVRNLPAEPSSTLSTSTIGGSCISRQFNLDTMNINYETIGQSAGRGNSFARQINGDCLWLKDPQQSAGTTNNKSTTATSSLNTVLSVTNVNSCSNNGKVSISFPGTVDYSSVFPVNYILAKDADSNNVYDLNDTYINGTDSTSPTVNISGLSRGSYHLTLEPASGCNYQFYSFTILACNAVILEPNTFLFSATKLNKSVQLLWTAQRAEKIQKFEIEKSLNGNYFERVESYQVTSKIPSVQNFRYYDPQLLPAANYYRIKIFYNDNTIAYSRIEKIEEMNTDDGVVTILPNPVENILNINLNSNISQYIRVFISQIDGKIISSKQAHINTGYNNIPIETGLINRGIYIIKLYKQDGSVIVKKIYKQ